MVKALIEAWGAFAENAPYNEHIWHLVACARDSQDQNAKQFSLEFGYGIEFSLMEITSMLVYARAENRAKLIAVYVAIHDLKLESTKRESA